MPARRLTEEHLDQIVSMREAGASYGLIAKKIDCSGNAISWQCLRLAAESPNSKWKSWDSIKGPAVLHRGGHIVRRFTPEDDAELLRLEAEGLSISEIARRLDRRWNSTRGRLMSLARRDERREHLSIRMSDATGEAGMTPLTTNDLISRTDDIKEKHPHYWSDEQAQAEMKVIWGEEINAQGVFIESPEELLYHRDGYKATISIGTANGLFAFGCGFQTPTQGYGGAPSIWDELFTSHAEARTAAIEYLLTRLPSPLYPHEENQRGQLDRMRQAVADLLRQPSLF